ncbi:GDYXXLXY domain-containing protein [Leptospira sp. GIMC2001]|uniref:GDYXXLXY domain-containing protein n=1 Tax=Leptospira sp. GIMC2001 TaxID=1513297 RepID=UPI00234B03C7|nr:GDYXXLXY domain-containing protein [Leptospira sp. GIMC2001]WCL47657.1 GDYXXLXY domain-containing protein [Leptospira sp. GIMC2001]
MKLNNFKSVFILGNLSLLLIYLNYSVMNKEELLAKGELIKFELAPVDPRSLIQGDYMELRYAITNEMNIDDIPKRGFIVVTLDSNGIGQRVRLQDDIQPLNDGEYVIRYSKGFSRSNLSIGAESYFFEEGSASQFEKAKYGGLMVDRVGNSLLVGMYDAEGNKL